MSTATKKAPAKKASGTKSSGPSYLDMIKQAIVSHPEDARTGLSRPTLKKFIHAKYPATNKSSEASFNTNLSKAIARGAETGVLNLPKGPSGRVKLAAKAKTTSAEPKKAAAPAKKAPVKKAAAGTSTKAKTPATKKAPAKKAASSTTTKAKKPAAKKAAPKKAAAKPKKAAAKK